MALQLMKLAITATSTIATDPNLEKFFYVTTSETAGGTTLTIDTADFFDDAGAVATELPVLATDNSMFNVYINGVLQMQNISTYVPGATTVGSLEITVPAGVDSIIVGSPVVLEVVNFTPTSTTTVIS
ncbi:MAG TPA: DUF4183 domain-containing protein [Candidatus Paenibacillus intestinavium]|nr:DUF4183 domain-containing protein [Candidatus Paenibacillus intestinavium]